MKNSLILFFLYFNFQLIGQKTPEELVKNDWPNTVNSFGTLAEKESSHYIFVIDISDKRFGKDIVDQIEVFTEALPQNDKITIIQLGPTDETKEFVTTTDIDKEILQEIKRKLKSLVNEGKFGTNGSDGLKMTKLILKCLQASGTRNSLPFVYIFSDLEYYPYRNFPAASEWIKCQTEYASLTFKYSPFIKSFKTLNKKHIDFLKDFRNNELLYDDIIMNPPYIKIQDIPEDYRNFIKKLYPNVLLGSFDIYHVFILACIEKLKDDGIMTMITPNNYLTSKSAKNIREYLIKNRLVQEIIDFESEKVFPKISVYCCITVISKINKLKDDFFNEINEINELKLRDICSITKH